MGTHTAGAAREEVNPKRTARREARVRIARLDPAWVIRASDAIARRVLALPAWSAASAVSAYLARPLEVQTRGLIEAAFAAGKRVCVPAWRADQGAYGLAWIGPDTAMKTGALGIEEPAQPVWARPAEPGLLLVPLLAFDAYGRRLGHGGGYYDRLLSGCAGVKVGLAFDGQRLAAVPAEAHDVPLDLIVTETALHAPGAATR